MSVADRVSGKEFTRPATGWYDTERKPAEFSDSQAFGEYQPRRSIASHAIVVLARARALRLRQAETNP